MYSREFVDPLNAHVLSSLIEYWISSSAVRKDFEISRGKICTHQLFLISLNPLVPGVH